MAEKPADTDAAPKVEAAPVDNVYLDLDTKEFVRIVGDISYRYQPGPSEFSVMVETKAYRTVSGRKSA